MSELVTEAWYNPITENTVLILETTPGVVYITTDTVRELVRQLGFTEKVDA